MIANPEVVIADDHQVIRAAVREALENDGCVVSAETDNARDAVRLCLEHRPDACLLDIGMPGNGIWAIREIKKALPECRVLMLTVSSSSADLFDALQAGAVGYLMKDIAPSDIPKAVRSALTGRAVLGGDLVAKLIDEFRRGRGRLDDVTNAEGHRVSFTPREVEILGMLMDDLSTSEIAKRLFIRPITVRRHIADAMHKLRVTSREEAMALLHAQAPPNGD